MTPTQGVTIGVNPTNLRDPGSRQQLNAFSKEFVFTVFMFTTRSVSEISVLLLFGLIWFEVVARLKIQSWPS